MSEVVIDSTTQAPAAEVHSADVQPGGTIDWRTSIPVELRSEKSLENVKDLPTLVKNYVESQKYIGGAIKIPGEKATPEELKSFYTKLGVPEKAADYKIARPVLPEYVGWSEEIHGKVLDLAHGASLNAKQTAKLVEGLSGLMSSVTPDPNAKLKESETALQGEWGDNYGRNILLASRAAEHLGGQELLDALQETGAGMHPVIVKALSKFGSGLLEQGLIKNQDTKIETVADAQSKIDAIKADAKHPYWDAKHPGHAVAVEEYRRLLQIQEANQ